METLIFVIIFVFLFNICWTEIQISSLKKRIDELEEKLEDAYNSDSLDIDFD